VRVAPTRSGHVESSRLKKQHARAFKTLREEAAKSNEKAIRPFVLCSLRHTFLTRLGESGCDAWTLVDSLTGTGTKTRAGQCFFLTSTFIELIGS